METIRAKRVIGSLVAAVVAGLFVAAAAPSAIAAEAKSTRNEAEWVKYDAAAKTVTLKIKKAGARARGGDAQGRPAGRVQRPARGHGADAHERRHQRQEGRADRHPDRQDRDRLLDSGREGREGAASPARST